MNTEQMVEVQPVAGYNQVKSITVKGSADNTSPNLTPSAQRRRLEAMPDSTSRPDNGSNPEFQRFLDSWRTGNVPKRLLINPEVSDAAIRFYAVFDCVGNDIDQYAHFFGWTPESVKPLVEELVKAGYARWELAPDGSQRYAFLRDDTSQYGLVYRDSPKKSTPKKHHGYVYLIQSPTGAYKIGRAKTLSDRIHTFQVKLPFEVEFLHSFECANYIEAEAKLHAKFEQKRINGEWFALSAEDVEWIKSIQSDEQL